MNNASDNETVVTPPQGSQQGPRKDTIRARLNAPVTISIDHPDGTRLAIGTANLRDLSLQGALITELNVSPPVTFETDVAYAIKFRLTAGPLSGMEAVCSAVRYDASLNGFGLRIPDGFRLPLM